MSAHHHRHHSAAVVVASAAVASAAAALVAVFLKTTPRGVVCSSGDGCEGIVRQEAGSVCIIACAVQLKPPNQTNTNQHTHTYMRAEAVAKR